MNDLPIPHKPYKNSVDYDLISTLILQNKTTKEICRAAHCSKHSVQNRKKEMGLQRPYKKRKSHYEESGRERPVLIPPIDRLPLAVAALSERLGITQFDVWSKWLVGPSGPDFLSNYPIRLSTRYKPPKDAVSDCCHAVVDIHPIRINGSVEYFSVCRKCFKPSGPITEREEHGKEAANDAQK